MGLSPLLSITFPLRFNSFHTGPLFPITFPVCSCKKQFQFILSSHPAVGSRDIVSFFRLFQTVPLFSITFPVCSCKKQFRFILPSTLRKASRDAVVVFDFSRRSFVFYDIPGLFLQKTIPVHPFIPSCDRQRRRCAGAVPDENRREDCLFRPAWTCGLQDQEGYRIVRRSLKYPLHKHTLQL